MINLLILGLIVLGSLIGSFGNIFIKKGTNSHGLFQLWKSRNIWWGMLLFLISTVLYLVILPFVELSFVYPLSSLTYIWTTFLSLKYLGEKMNVWKWTGLAGIIFGIVLIGMGS